MYPNFEALKARVLRGARRTIALAAAADPHSLEAVRDAEALLGVDYFLVGDAAKIAALAAQIGFDIKSERVIPASTDEEAAALAVALVREGRADVLMKGRLQTATLLKAVLHRETGIRGAGQLSHLCAMECAAYPKLLFQTDGGINPHPNLAQKRAILENALAFMHALGYKNPKVAVLAAVETVSDKMPETQDAAALAAANIPGCILEGPLSFDLAISSGAAAIKGVESAVSGDADLLLVPNVATGNIMTKALLYLGGAKMAGCVLGAAAPIILVSRGASAEEKLYSIMMALAG
ncbi:MAG: phosphate acyltransferase [Clostridiales bacterium]|nr:phosphate acyltransferase [Clostridiales bacterium]